MPYRAGFRIRVVAMMLDAIVATIFLVGFYFLHDFVWYRTYDEWRAEAIASLAFYAAWLAYSSMEIWIAGTPGKLLIGLRIVNSDGSPANRWRLFLRWETKYLGAFYATYYFVSGLVAFDFLAHVVNSLLAIGFLFALNDDRMSWHDQSSATAVCWKRRKPAPLTAPPPLPAA